VVAVCVQVVLTGEPSLVSLAVALLEIVMEHNGPALALLYQTGIFFFALAYCGSNLVEIGRLFKVCTHDVFPRHWHPKHP
jgi:DnaJ family protein C protein 13